MNGSKLIDEINRLFEQLVRDPWSGPPSSAGRVRSGERLFEVALPIAIGQRGDVGVAIEGRRLVVRAQRPVAPGTPPSTFAEHVFSLPEDADVTGIEAQFEDGTLRVRVRLQGGRP
ncbi:MAG: Hsp20/alpha crystallin family protein [Candidatus Binatia bacterium]